MGVNLVFDKIYKLLRMFNKETYDDVELSIVLYALHAKDQFCITFLIALLFSSWSSSKVVKTLIYFAKVCKFKEYFELLVHVYLLLPFLINSPVRLGTEKHV